jgi:nucleotide-binding universal stress UspA family protein
MTASAILENPSAARAGEGLRDIVVHVDDTPAGTARLGYAARLARAWDAHLVAVHVQPSTHLPSRVSARVNEILVEAWRKQIEETTARVASRIAAAGRAEGLTIEYRFVEGLADERLLAHARHADLTVIGQPGDPARDEQTHIVETLLFGSGRPILIVPSVGSYDPACRRVLCAWNASREAARALADAMPLLRRADAVTVLSADPEGGAHRVPGADIALHLARHGVKAATSATYAGDLPVGDALLNRAADLGADLLVMGGYGHSRTREAIYGGATRSVLDHMTLPVLMAH